MGNRLNAIVGQSGGPTAAINATLAGVIRGASRLGVRRLYGMENGVLGLLADRLISLDHLYLLKDQLSALELTPAAALGSCRFRLPDDFSDPVYKRVFAQLEKYNIGYFFYIGGNDSMDTAAKLHRYAKENGYPVSVIGIPKTIDNDLVLTDHTPGYGSCAKYVATVAYELARDVCVYNAPSVTLLEVMGREAGWIGCAASLSRHYFGCGCDLVYLPEGGFNAERFLRDVEACLGKKKTILACVSEGVNGGAEGHTVDAFGHKQLEGIGDILSARVKKELGVKSRAVELGLTQRCASHIVSRTDIEESVRIGMSAVEYAVHGESGKMVAFARRNGEYGVDIVTVDASAVANAVKRVPREYINAEGNFVTEKCIEYVSPLIMGEKNIEYVLGLPKHISLRRGGCV